MSVSDENQGFEQSEVIRLESEEGKTDNDQYAGISTYMWISMMLLGVTAEPRSTPAGTA